MTRWHQQGCSVPDVYIDNKSMPKCRACGSACPPIAELVAKLGSKTSGIVLPPDEPHGQFDLWWPKDVPYINQTPKEEMREHIQSSQSQPLASRLLKLALNDKEVANPHIYEKTLESNEFRLVCLTAAPHEEDYPVHLRLETYTHENRPEYETVSYIWGGEDGDSSPSRPIFIGLHWDILLQTQNCWAMLKFVRPWRGQRMLWVDALCINQGDLDERTAQVARMRQIYKESERVIVYLGEDIATSTTDFPIYRNLDDINSGHDLDKLPSSHGFARSADEVALRRTDNLSRLLHRAYFSRVWVIQELVVTGRAIFRVGNVDFRADPTIVQRLLGQNKTPFSWSQTRAPWVQYLGQKAFNPARVTNIVSLAALTSRCRASDPRDRIFAITQLLVDPKLRENLSPNYALSFQHFAIGFFAHALLVTRNLDLLDYAGSLHSAFTPSWVPDCRSDAAWERVLKTAAPRNQDLRRYRDIFAEDCQVYYDERSVTTVKEATIAIDYQPRRNVPTIDAATGSLAVDLTHLFTFTHKPRMIRQYGNVYLYEVVTKPGKEPSTGLRLCFFAWTRLQIEVGHHLFAWPRDDATGHNSRQSREEIVATKDADDLDRRGLTYLILRPCLSRQVLSMFQLVTTRVALCASYPSVHEDSNTSTAYIQSDWNALRNLNSPRLSEVQASVSSVLLSIMKLIHSATNTLVSRGDMRFMAGMPTGPISKSWEHAADTCEAYYKDYKGEMYFGVLGGYLGYLQPVTASSLRSPRTVSTSGLRLPKALSDFLTRCNLMVLLDALKNAFQPTLQIEELCRMIRAGPTEAQRSIPIHKYINGVRVDGTVTRVLIV